MEEGRHGAGVGWDWALVWRRRRKMRRRRWEAEKETDESKDLDGEERRGQKATRMLRGIRLRGTTHPSACVCGVVNRKRDSLQTEVK
jgi:hypothetical protein